MRLKTLQVYLVGGAVRDALLQREVTERDWVVVGATPEAMLAQGFRQVGKDFPVFLHPQTGEEYALARTERKSGHGYAGFICQATPDVTLEQDLLRRDLTINAMAQSEDGQIIDPYGGQNDLQARLLRHVSPAFAEDPLRILRVARFAARYHPLGFRIAAETSQLMQTMVAAGEVAHLVPERVWQEMVKALKEQYPSEFFEILRDTGALQVILPELTALAGVPNPARWHPEIDTWVHVMMVVNQAARLSTDTKVRFAALLHDLGKGTTPPELWPKHHGHEARGVALVNAVCQRLRVPKEYAELAQLSAEYHTHCHRCLELTPKTLLHVLERTDALRRPERFEAFLLACEADFRGRKDFTEKAYPQADLLREIATAVRQVKPDPATLRNQTGPQIADALRILRLDAIRAVLAARG